MMHENDTIDEETTLLPRRKEHQGPTPLPKAQIGVLLLLQVCGPVATYSISPYINQLISELDITGGDERKVGYYAGVIQSLFSLTEAIMVMPWSRLSDRVGRKPVLLLGLAGASLSILLFGLSRTFWTLAFSRCLCGFLNGNSGVMKSAVGELTDPSNRPRAFSLMPVVWAAGSTLGPLMGGSLSRPHERFPTVFTGQFWIDYPYFLPCLAVSGFIGLIFIITLLFLKESTPSHHRHGSASADSPPVRHGDSVPFRELLVYPVLISVSNYMALAFLITTLNALLPLFFAMPTHIGGLGFEPSTIGYIMGVYGLSNGIFQILFFPRIIRRFSTRSIFIGSVMVFIPIYLLFPVMSAIAQRFGVNIVVWALIALVLSLMIFMGMAYGCILLYVTASAPNRHSLGATNGLAQTSVSLAQTFGPAISTSLFSLSVEHNLMGGYAVYVILLGVSCLAILLAARLPEAVWEEQKGDDTEPSH